MRTPAALVLLGALACGGPGADRVLDLATTTSTRDSGTT